MLEVEGVTFTYPHAPREAVKNLTWTVFPGETWAVVGRNGSGKSTLALLLNGILKPQKGRVRVEGLDTREEGNLKEIRRRVGVVFQDPDNQLIAQTVEEDVAFGLENLGLPPEAIRQRVEEILDLLDLRVLRHRPPARLSGGQKQRVALAGILVMEPRYLILDEATAMLDPVTREEIWDLLFRWKRERDISLVFITHNMEEASLAEKMLVLREGEVFLKGPSREILEEQEKLREAGLRAPSLIDLGQRLRARGIEVPPGVASPREMARALWSLGWKR